MAEVGPPQRKVAACRCWNVKFEYTEPPETPEELPTGSWVCINPRTSSEDSASDSEDGADLYSNRLITSFVETRLLRISERKGPGARWDFESSAQLPSKVLDSESPQLLWSKAQGVLQLTTLREAAVYWQYGVLVGGPNMDLDLDLDQDNQNESQKIVATTLSCPICMEGVDVCIDAQEGAWMRWSEVLRGDVRSPGAAVRRDIRYHQLFDLALHALRPSQLGQRLTTPKARTERKQTGVRKTTDVVGAGWMSDRAVLRRELLRLLLDRKLMAWGDGDQRPRSMVTRVLLADAVKLWGELLVRMHPARSVDSNDTALSQFSDGEEKFGNADLRECGQLARFVTFSMSFLAGHRDVFVAEQWPQNSAASIARVCQLYEPLHSQLLRQHAQVRDCVERTAAPPPDPESSSDAFPAFQGGGIDVWVQRRREVLEREMAAELARYRAQLLARFRKLWADTREDLTRWYRVARVDHAVNRTPVSTAWSVASQKTALEGGLSPAVQSVTEKGRQVDGHLFKEMMRSSRRGSVDTLLDPRALLLHRTNTASSSSEQHRGYAGVELSQSDLFDFDEDVTRDDADAHTTDVEPLHDLTRSQSADAEGLVIGSGKKSGSKVAILALREDGTVGTSELQNMRGPMSIPISIVPRLAQTERPSASKDGGKVGKDTGEQMRGSGDVTKQSAPPPLPSRPEFQPPHTLVQSHMAEWQAATGMHVGSPMVENERQEEQEEQNELSESPQAVGDSVQVGSVMLRRVDIAGRSVLSRGPVGPSSLSFTQRAVDTTPPQHSPDNGAKWSVGSLSLRLSKINRKELP